MCMRINVPLEWCRPTTWLITRIQHNKIVTLSIMCTINIHSYFYDPPRGDPSPPVIFIYFSQLFNLFLRLCDPVTLVITEITPTNSKFHTVQYTGIQVLFCLPDPNIFNNTASQSLNHNKLLLKAVIFIERSDYISDLLSPHNLGFSNTDCHDNPSQRRMDHMSKRCHIICW